MHPGKLLFVFFLLISTHLFFACGDQNETLLHYTASRGDFDIRVDGDGILEAKKSHNIVVPNLRYRRLKVAELTDEGKRVKKGDIVILLESTEIESDYLQALDELAIAKTEAAKRDSELEMERLELVAQVKSIEASVEQSRLQLAKLDFEPPLKQKIQRLEIESDEIELKKIRSRLNNLEAIQKEERTRYQLKIQQEETKRDQAKGFLDQLTVRAPADGIFEHARTWWGWKANEGDELYPGRPIAKIPELDVMQVRVQVGETEAQKCQVDQKSEIFFPSLNELTLPGRVTLVNPFANPIERGSKVKFVEVIVEVDSTDIFLTPGLSARANIVTESFSNVFSVPPECIFEQDSVKVVYARSRNKYQPHAIRILKQNEDDMIVLCDLEEEAHLALRQPAESWINRPDSLIIPELPVRADSLSHEEFSPEQPDQAGTKVPVNIQMKNSQ